ncbi:putative LRR receptor-like serine/threonine-protein kinase [Abeliophyllum distichum]|uniref:non-specific serine/threonine protein kinase n=1 Tax=Abeliophyllum distichum TaxID=126358 RepID=A0ABD1TXB5_9LAMI
MERICFLKSSAVLWMLYILACFTRPTEGNSIDQSALLSLKESITIDPNQLTVKNWSINASVCSWIGVTCNSRHHRVAELNLPNMALEGSIPPQLGNLSFIVYLNLSGNSFHGKLPQELANLRRLKFMDFGINVFTGFLPQTILNISTLQILILQKNNLSGNLPEDICHHAPNLRLLSLADNRLTGTIPSSISGCTQLRILALEGNNLTGSIPREIGNLTMLKTLYLDSNNLEGFIPQELGSMNGLERLNLQANSLSGSVPANLFNMTTLRILGLTQNHFSGRLPSNIGYGMPNLEKLYLDVNNLNGVIPDSISNYSKLMLLDLSANEFTGLIPNTFGNLRFLEVLGLNQNNLESDQELSFINSLAGCKYLQEFTTGGNPLNGILPASIGNISNLETIDMSFCGIKGDIPKQIECLGNVSSLRNLYLGFNKLTSSIPVSLWKLKDILQFNLTSNLLSGSLPSEISSLKALNLLDLSLNQFSGDIPSTISEIPNLINISLASNKFEGTIPDSIGKLISLEMLDLSNNSLTGMIPKSLEALQHLTRFNVSFNELSGEIPSGGPFENFTYQSFMSNNAICGKPQFHVPPCQGSSHSSSEKIVLLAVLIPTTASAAITLVIVLLLSRYRKRQVQAQADSLPDIMPERISYYQLQRATDDFSNSNLLGRGSFGSVFKGSFTDGTLVAIKVFQLQLEGAFKSFETECAVLRNLRHRNLTKVISSCSNLDFKALVLEYMPNGSLEKWMHSNGHFLDIVQRLNIMTDVACAVKYLHHGYSPPVVHCDLKPSNILLDQDMVGHVSDFGIAKLFGEEETLRHTMTLATLGYIAPEYGAEGLVSTSCDVYSYGILLMETFTRRRPTDEMFSEDSSLRSWIANSIPHAIDRVVDANLISPEEKNVSRKLNCISSITEMAVNCSAESPGNRPSMKDVVASLQKIKVQLLAYS